MLKILVLGANSAIAKAVCRLWVEEGHALYLVGRQASKLEALQADLKVRGQAQIFAETADLSLVDQHSKLLARAKEQLGGLDRVFIAYGELGDQQEAELSVAAMERSFQSNFVSQAAFLTLVANEFEQAKKGQILVITSVAGDRGRQSNYVYGTAKGALSLFLSGLRNRLYSSSVNVLDLKLGFVDTPMTAAIPKGGPLWAKPHTVAKAIVRAAKKRRDVVYIPSFWGLIMLIIRSIPEGIFKRLKL